MNTFNAADLGQRVRKARLVAGLRQKDLADQLKTSSSQVKRWEHGQVEPTITRLFQIADLTGSPVTWLLGLEGNSAQWTNEAEPNK